MTERYDETGGTAPWDIRKTSEPRSKLVDPNAIPHLRQWGDVSAKSFIFY